MGCPCCCPSYWGRYDPSWSSSLRVVDGPLDWTEDKIVVLLDSCFDSSIIINGGVLTFGLVGTLVLLLDSCDLRVAIQDVKVVGKSVLLPGGATREGQYMPG